MPEGDTIATLAGRMHTLLAGRPLQELALLRPRRVLQPGRVESVDARAKHLLVHLHDGRVLRTHLGMHGSWHAYPRGARWQRPLRQARVLLVTAETELVCFNPLEVELLRAHGDAVRRRVFAQRLGPDLTAGGDVEVLAAQAVARAHGLLTADVLLLDALLDQRIAGGIGNVYKCELMFLHGLAPDVRVGALDAAALGALYGDAARLLRANVGGGCRVTRPVPAGAHAPAGDRLWVYGRASRPCFRCRTPVVSAVAGVRARRHWWCPECQRGSGADALGASAPGRQG